MTSRKSPATNPTSTAKILLTAQPHPTAVAAIVEIVARVAVVAAVVDVAGVVDAAATTVAAVVTAATEVLAGNLAGRCALYKTGRG